MGHEEPEYGRSLTDALYARTQYPMMTITQVAEHLSVARSTVDELEFEILPYINLGGPGKRQLKRYNRVDVVAAEIFLHELRAAEQQGRREKYLEQRRCEQKEWERSFLQGVGSKKGVSR